MNDLAKLRRNALMQIRLLEMLIEQERIAPAQIERHAHNLLKLVRAIKADMGRHANDGHARGAEAHESGQRSVWQDAMDQLSQRIAGLEALVEHQEAMAFSSDESRGELNAYRRVLEWMVKQESISQSEFEVDVKAPQAFFDGGEGLL